MGVDLAVRRRAGGAGGWLGQGVVWVASRSGLGVTTGSRHRVAWPSGSRGLFMDCGVGGAARSGAGSHSRRESDAWHAARCSLPRRAPAVQAGRGSPITLRPGASSHDREPRVPVCAYALDVGHGRKFGCNPAICRRMPMASGHGGTSGSSFWSAGGEARRWSSRSRRLGAVKGIAARSLAAVPPVVHRPARGEALIYVRGAEPGFGSAFLRRGLLAR